MYLAQSVHSSGSSEVRPEVFSDMFDSINSKSIDIVGRDQVGDPCIQGRNNSRVFRVDICQCDGGIPKPALFNISLVSVVRDEALSVEVRHVRERGDGSEVETWRESSDGHVVHDDIEHEVHAPFVKCRRKSLQVVSCTEIGVERVEILGPITEQ